MITIKKFKALKRDDMYQQLKEDFPGEATGMTRATKGRLVATYESMMSHPDMAAGVKTGRLDSSKPNEGNTPKPDLPEVAGIEEMAAEGEPNVALRLPLREHAGLHFVAHGDDPMRELRRREKLAIEDLAKFVPQLGPKHQSAPKGVQGRKVWDPHKAARKRVKQAAYFLNCAKIQIVQGSRAPAGMQEKA